MSNTTREPAFRSYLAEVRRRHGYMRFLGLPYLRDTPDVDIARLYVAPAVSAQLISADTAVENWPATESPLEALGRNRRLILRGDPGSGKSTIINWFAWRLAAGLSQPLPEWMEGLLPLPFVLRELPMRGVKDFDSLLEAFLGHALARPLAGSRDALEAQLKAGRVLFMLDGLDEIRPGEREKLRQAVWEGWLRYPNCYWLLTSRVVGYEEVSFNPESSLRSRPEQKLGEYESAQIELPEMVVPGEVLGDYLHHLTQSVVDRPSGSVGRSLVLSRGNSISSLAQLGQVGLAYVAPFDDERIRAFARNWYALRERTTEDAARESGKFLDALATLPATWRLARTPNLLTMMALIFRVRARLPDGRALLYGDIAQAYLESIDQYRGVLEDRFPLAQKKRWLARVAFEMHWQRSQQIQEDDEDLDLLAPESSVREWIVEAMAESGYGDDRGFADEYLDFVARRSGLLLPRGEGLYAFLHLSFQEYFSAWYLVEQIRHPQWRTKMRTGLDPRFKPSSLKAWASDSRWRETLVFVFEILGQEPGWAEALCDQLFGSHFKTLEVGDTWKKLNRATLLARLAADPHSGMNRPLRQSAVRAVCAFAIHPNADFAFLPASNVFSVLLGGEETKELAWSALAELQPNTLDLLGSSVDWARLVEALPQINSLIIGDGDVGDMAPLSHLSKLISIQIYNASNLTDLTTLVKLHSLRRVGLGALSISDLAPLAQLSELRQVYLANIAVGNLQALSRVPLEGLGIFNCTNFDLNDIHDFSQLRELSFFRQHLDGLAILRTLPHLEEISFRFCRIDDPEPLVSFSQIKRLDLYRCEGISEDFVRRLQALRPDLLIEYSASDTQQRSGSRKRKGYSRKSGRSPTAQKAN